MKILRLTAFSMFTLAAGVTVFLMASCGRPEVVEPQDGAITVRVQPAATTVRYLDGMYWPQGSACGRAYTYWSFICRPEIRMRQIPEESKEGEYMFEITGVSMNLSLPLTIWLPFGVQDKLREHEDGHRKMCEQTYKKADEIARQCARELMSKHMRAYANDLRSAREIADIEARRSLDSNYHIRITGIADGSGAIYDRITNHGMNEVPVDKAIKESFEEYFQTAKANEKIAKAAKTKETEEKAAAAAKEISAKTAKVQKTSKTGSDLLSSPLKGPGSSKKK